MKADAAWQLLLALRRVARQGGLPADGFGVSDDGEVVAAESAAARVEVAADGSWSIHAALDEDAARLLDLHLAFACAGPGRPMILGHLGQSLDGRIATVAGQSHYVTGEENLDHLHRLRALADAVIIGVGTARQDNPRLTTRRVPGPNPVRVVIDPSCSLPRDTAAFAESSAPILLVCSEKHAKANGGVDTIAIEPDGDVLPPTEIVSRLHARGLHALFVEGGGVTVSRFLAAGVLDRLQITVAPMILGSGRPGITLPLVADLSGALRPACRTLAMGRDVLFDCDLRT